ARQRVYAIRRKPLSSIYWTLIIPAAADAGAVWQAISSDDGVTPAGSLTFNVVRIRSGRPGVSRELTQDYIPLEVGLWDEVSFTKGCYTGQEIIARMESRARMAKVMVRVSLSDHVNTPAPLMHDGKTVGNVTSSVKAPDGEVFGIAVVKTAVAEPEITLRTQQGVSAEVIELAASAPPVAMLD
ncbi:MAG: glycine cleavage system protein T, partial [Chloroflexota bacterium]